MTVHNLTLGQNIQAAITAGAAGDTYNFAAGTYYGQSWTPNSGDFYIGAPGGGTILSGGWKVSSWTNVSGNWYKATQGNGDLFANTNFPAPLGTAAKITGSITGTTLTVASVISGTVATGTTLYCNGGANFTQITAGSGTSWTVTPSQTIGAGTAMILIANNGNNTSGGDPNFFWAERAFLDGVPLTKITCATTPADPGLGNYYFNLADNSLNINIGGSPTGHTIEYTCQGTILDTSASINNVTLSNFTVSKYGYYMRGAPFTFFGAQVGWNFYNMNFSYNKTFGINYNGPSYPLAATSTLRINGGSFTNNGIAGVSAACGEGSMSGVLFAYNNQGRTAFQDNSGDAGGFKMVQTLNFTVDECVSHDNGGPGMWFDIDSTAVVISDNTSYNNMGPGIMYEISWGPSKIINNTCYGNTNGSGSSAVDCGIYISNSSDVEAYGNTCSVAVGHASRVGGGIDMYNGVRGNSSTGPHSGIAYEARNNKVHHNKIYYMDNSGATDGYAVDQTIAGGSNNYRDFNTYYTPNGTGVWWYHGTDAAVNTAYTWTAYQAAGFEPNSVNLIGQPPAQSPLATAGLFR